jgi:hypothetical protein
MQLTGFSYHLRKLLHCGEKIIMTHCSYLLRECTNGTLCMSLSAQTALCAKLSKSSQTFNTKYFMRTGVKSAQIQVHAQKLYTPPIERQNALLFYDVHTQFLLGYDERKKCHPIGGCIKIREISMLYYIITYKHCFFDFISFLRERTYKKKRNVIIFLHKVHTTCFCAASLLCTYKYLRGKGLCVARFSSKKFHNDRLYTRCVEGFALILSRFGKLLMFKELQAKFFSKLGFEKFYTRCRNTTCNSVFVHVFPAIFSGSDIRVKST